MLSFAKFGGVSECLVILRCPQMLATSDHRSPFLESWGVTPGLDMIGAVLLGILNDLAPLHQTLARV